MESKINRRLLVVGVLAFIGVVLLVTTVVVAYTALVALITGIDGPPQALVVQKVPEPLENVSVIHLTDRDLKQHPVLDSAIRDANRNPDVWISGVAPMTGIEYLVLIESFGIDAREEDRPYLEYDGAYYLTRVLLH
ncbi:MULTISPECIES: hypothetical protein [unclassified Methanoculleus]|jgi:hypothetical protein|uniref:Uncharacterized protein n=1 Tax=Methanoculleus palmolei TaxID=72612 RepID=A0ABD8A9A4_9EURY|nr:hypothetical protein [Methanoculleus sp. UBA377]MDD2473368.1 hypothetical protein [Methanoculleus sp.]WOX56095.1 hypothetical protein R6Y95_01870 [Methanoculleus palmolei]